MAASSFILEHWENEQRTFSDNLSLLREKITVDNVHDLRVAIKKIRSYDKLCSAILDKKDHKNNQIAVTRLFNILGKYRDLQKNLELLAKEKKEHAISYRSINEFLQRALLEAQKKIGTELKRSALRDEMRCPGEFREALLSFTQAGIIKKIRKQIRESVQELPALVKNINEEAHTVRKKSKDIFYWLSVCPDNSVIGTSKLKKLDSIQDHLGNWQDRRVLMRKIRFFRKEMLPAEMAEYKRYKKLEERMNEKSHLALNDASGQMTKWLKEIFV